MASIFVRPRDWAAARAMAGTGRDAVVDGRILAVTKEIADRWGMMDGTCQGISTRAFSAPSAPAGVW